MPWLLAMLCLQSQTFSVEKEIVLGAQLARDFRSRTELVQDDRIQKYAASIGFRLASHTSSSFPWSFEVVSGLDNHLASEPLSIPGGHIFIPAKLLLTAQSEPEFGGMLAHAMAHQEARDTTRFVIPAGLTGWSTIPLVFLGQGNIPLAFRAIQKEKEEAATRLGAQIWQESGFDRQITNGDFPAIQARLQKTIPALQKRPAPSLFP